MKSQIWRTLLEKIGMRWQELTDMEISFLVERWLNGRDIKNIVSTAEAIARGQNKPAVFSHLSDVISVMDQVPQVSAGYSYKLNMVVLNTLLSD
jgi:hypothetical protein